MESRGGAGVHSFGPGMSLASDIPWTCTERSVYAVAPKVGPHSFSWTPRFGETTVVTASAIVLD